MRKNAKYIVTGILIVIIITIAVLIIININKKEDENTLQEAEEEIEVETAEEENVLIVNIGKQEEEQQQEETSDETVVKDAATLTQEIYDINSTIGTLYIPKTGLTTQIYSNVTVDAMEIMPCFLYTTGGLNATGVTLFVGHNRVDGTIFSDNGKLEEGDEFYFTDNNGIELKYTIYSKFVTVDTDVSFLNESVECPTIALSCCTDADDENRIVILGRAQ